MAAPLLLAFLVGGGLLAQEEPPIITGFVVEGAGVTKHRIILRELSHPLGQPFDSTLAREDRNRLYNLGIFEWVDIRPRPSNPGKAELVVEVVETIRMIPFPLVDHVEDLGWYYGGGISYLNFRGLNQRLEISATFGVQKSYTLVFADPWMLGNQIGVTGWLLQVFRSHPVHPFRTRLRDLEFSLGKSNLPKTVDVRVALSLEQRIEHWLEEGHLDTVHHVFQGKVDFLWRTTDIWRDPTRGIRFRLFLSPVVALDEQSPSYVYFRLGAATFFKARGGERPLVIGASLTLAHYNRETPLYLKQYVGGRWVRGYHVDPSHNADRISGRQEATSVAQASIELRQTLFPRRLLWRWEMGISGVVFVDAGWGYEPNEPLSKAQPLVGYGVGLRVFMPILNVVAIDAGGNPYDSGLRVRMRFSQSF